MDEKSIPQTTLKPHSIISAPIEPASLDLVDEAQTYLSTHPDAASLLIQGQALLSDPKQHDRLVRKIDLTIVPLLACVYFLQFLDKTTLTYTSVMGIRDDTNLKGQDYSNLSMLFYIGMYSLLNCDSWW